MRQKHDNYPVCKMLMHRVARARRGGRCIDLLTVFYIITRFDAFENIMENRTFSLLGANAPFSLILSKVFNTLLKFC